MAGIALNRVKQWWPLLLFCLILLVLALAPGQPHDRSGSTYSRDPDGYGAWSAYMEERGTPIQRWRKSLSDWEDYVAAEQDDRAFTLLRIHSQPVDVESERSRFLPGSFLPDRFLPDHSRVITLGVKTPATLAPYRSHHATDQGLVRLDTRRRLPFDQLESPDQVILSDPFGVIAWQRSVPEEENRTLIWINSSHWAANAYQDFPSNYEFLAQLVTAAGGEIWVDEYLHGYQDLEPETTSGEAPTWQTYLQRSSLMVIFAQGCILFVLIWIAQNQRFGARLPVFPPSTDNTIAYIRALAGVLRQVNNHQFVGETLAKAEQQYVQNHLGLRGQPLTLSSLGNAWKAQTGRSPQEIEAVLKFPESCSDADLLQWLQQVATVRREMKF